MLVRSTPTTAHPSAAIPTMLRIAETLGCSARRSLIPSAVWRCATASRFAAGVTIFLKAGRSDLHCPASYPPAAACAGRSPHRAARGCFASDTSRPPDLAFHAYYVALDIPCRRHRSVTTAPALASFRMPMICSSENCFRFTCPSLLRTRTLAPTGGKNGQQVNRQHSYRLLIGPLDRADHHSTRHKHI